VHRSWHQKLFGWFGGGGVDGTTKLMASLGMNPPREQAVAAGVTEAGAGAMIAAGLGTPLAASALIGVMSTAIDKAHWPATSGMVRATRGLGPSRPGAR
jgi:putative oxidoreductase